MIDIELVKVVTELADKIANVAEKLAQMDGARVAHRHILRTFLASASDADVSELMEQLHAKADTFEGQFGEERMAGYRAELDILMIQARQLRNSEE